MDMWIWRLTLWFEPSFPNDFNFSVLVDMNCIPVNTLTKVTVSTKLLSYLGPNVEIKDGGSLWTSSLKPEVHITSLLRVKPEIYLDKVVLSLF